MPITILRKLENIQPFTDSEAWRLFRLAAIGEACGWTLLISGILVERFITPASTIPVLIAGQIHGTIFLVYIVAVVVLYSSLHWSRKRTIIAGLASIPPYGSLVFEQWAAYKRRSEALKTYREITVRAIIISGGKLLAVQPKDTGFWYLPGGAVKAGETLEQALQRTTLAQTGIVPAIGRLAYVVQQHHKSRQQLEMYFIIANPSDYPEKLLRKNLKSLVAIDEIAYTIPKKNPELRPAFLRTEPIVLIVRQPQAPVIFIQP